MLLPKTTEIPTLDLRDIEDQTEHKEAITGFLSKNAEHSTSVLVIGVDGVNRWLSTQPGRAELTIKELTTPKVYAGAEDEILVTDTTNVTRTFMELTAFTVPHGHEYEMYHTMLTRLGFTLNGRGNYWLTVGDGEVSKTLFVAHLDTADRGRPVKVNHLVTAENYVRTDGNSLLGADDRAGLAVLLYMIAYRVPGDYLLVVGEECGCVGSGLEAPHIPVGKYHRAIQFDRAGTSEVITHQMGRRTASREFARQLCREFRNASGGAIQLHPSDRGIYTDTKEFTEVISECTNIAIGYTGQHTPEEVQDLSYLNTIARAAVLVNWEALPTKQPYSTKGGVKDWYYDQTGDALVDDDWEDQTTLWEEPTVGYGKKTVWEMWAHVDSGEWDLDEVKRWIIYNPGMAAKVLVEYFRSRPTESLDTLTAVDMGG